MACPECRRLHSIKRNNHETNNDAIMHAHKCVHYANQHLVKFFNEEQTSLQTAFAVFEHKLIKNYYTIKHKKLFINALRILTNFAKQNRYTPKEYVGFIIQCIMRIHMTMGPEQLLFFCNDKSLIHELIIEYIMCCGEPDMLGQMIIFATRASMRGMEKYFPKKVRHISVECDMDNVYPQQSDIDESRRVYKAYKYQNIKCGNNNCRKSYTMDKYGFEPFPELSLEMLQKWENRNSRKKWYICKGCKTVYYCSRKCQKINWNKGEHRKHCKQLQRYI